MRIKSDDNDDASIGSENFMRVKRILEMLMMLVVRNIPINKSLILTANTASNPWESRKKKVRLMKTCSLIVTIYFY